jgi:four helix bundle protein
MTVARSFRELLVWQKAHALTLAVYEATKAFPREEMFGLTSQLRRASVSVAANIAEGFPKPTSAERARFLAIAQGSLEECRYYFILAADLSYADTVHLEALAEEVSKMLHAFRKAILTTDN